MVLCNTLNYNSEKSFSLKISIKALSFTFSRNKLTIFMSTSNRRQFLADLTMIGAASMLSQSLFAAKPSSIKIAYSAITWGGKDLNAMQDIASLGFKGIQLRANAYDNYKTKVQELKDLLNQHHLSLAMFSSGNVEVDTARISSNVDYHVAHASFVKALVAMPFN
jgi:inosose dehydratase